MNGRVSGVIVCVCLSLSTAPSLADDVTTPGKVTTPYPTIINLTVEWHVKGDGNLNGQVSVRYRRVGGEKWRVAMPLRRVPAGKSRGTDPIFTWANRHSGTIFNLRPGTEYEIHLKLEDPAGGLVALADWRGRRETDTGALRGRRGQMARPA